MLCTRTHTTRLLLTTRPTVALRVQSVTPTLNTGVKIFQRRTIYSNPLESPFPKPVGHKTPSTFTAISLSGTRIPAKLQSTRRDFRRSIHSAIDAAANSVPPPELFTPLLPSLFLIFPLFVVYVGAVQLALPHIVTFQSSPAQVRLLKQLPRWIIPLGLLGTAAIAYIAYDEAPTTHRPRLFLLRRWEEHRLAATAKTCVNQLAIDPRNTIINESDHRHIVVQKICDRLWTAVEALHEHDSSPTKALPPRPHIVLLDADHELDAISYPCGTITITTGWLRVIDFDQPMLAAVLAHEIAHMVQRHAAELYGVSVLVSVARKGLDAIDRGLRGIFLGGGKGHEDDDDQYYGTTVLTETPQIFMRKFSRGLEKEADLVGQRILAEAGYDPESAVSLWESMVDLEQRESLELEREHIFSSTRAHEHHRMSYDSPKSDTETTQMHPPRAERARYLRDNSKALRKIYEQTVEKRGEAETIRPDLKIVRGMAVMLALYAKHD